MADFTPLQPGTRVGGDIYEIKRLIKTGGMGAVYLVFDHELERELALKQTLSAVTELQLTRREARLLASVRHEALPVVYTFFSEHGSEFIVMDYVDGVDLADVLAQRGTIPLQEALVWADQLLAALEALHEKGVIHRDIKPHNIKLTSNRQIKLLDLGIAKRSDAADGTTSEHSVRAYTRQYAPREQILGLTTTLASDIDKSLRLQLAEWGMPIPDPTMSDEEVALLALQRLSQEPGAWSGGGQPCRRRQ